MHAERASAPEGFVAGTKVLTARGSVPVEAVRVGDWVVAHDVAGGAWGLRPVLRTFRHRGPSGVWLPRTATLAPQAPRGPPAVGAGQRLWTAGGWRYAGEAALGPDVRTYTFEVAEWHTYLVAGDEGWTLAHNQEARVTYYRVQGGDGRHQSKPLVSLDGSRVTIEHATLNVSTGSLDHARHFLQNRPGAQVVAFDVPLWLHEKMVAEAIPQLGYRTNPQNQGKTAPKVVDPTTPGDSYELPKRWARLFGEHASNGRVLSAEALLGFAPRGAEVSPAPTADYERARVAAEALFATLKGAGPAPLRDARLVIEPSPAVDVRADPLARTVHVSTGLLDAVATRAGRSPSAHRGAVLDRALSVILAHELEHLGGTKAERAADRGAVERLRAAGTVPEAGDLRLALELFAGSQPTLLERIRSFARYGTVRGRLVAFDQAARGAPDPLANFRRVDGTLRWGPMLGARAIHETAGAGKFTLGLFVKELTLVLQTGDEARMEEFFEGITHTDFWIHYGVFAKSARSAELLYGRSLGKYVKNRFANGLLRQNVALAAGLAVPQLLQGGFDGESFAISLTALGLSSTAVRLGVQGLTWIKPIQLGTSRLAKVGGFLAQVGETALVLYVADRIETTLRPALARRALRAELVAAAEALLEAAARGDTEAQAELLTRHAEAWQAWRDHLFDEVYAQDQRFNGRLTTLAESAFELEQGRGERLARLRDHAGLRAMIEGEHGSLEGWVAARQAADEDTLGLELEQAFDEHTASRAALLARVYAGERRASPLLAGWTEGASTWRGPATIQRRGRAHLRDALQTASANRLQTYEDEGAVLSAARALHPDAAAREQLAAAEARTGEALEFEGKVVRSARLEAAGR
ncbi:MAG: hypothetical protein KDD82_15775 [Planctomycetes bacterium]|nr:hypothetical protein [Planctomycetota bacterium]